jgi:N-methylhydantoinase B
MRVRNLVEGRWNFEMPRRSKCPPWGLWGGTPGESGGYLLKRPGERAFTMMAGSHIPVAIGAEAIVRTGGGGGWGDPLERDPALVASDVAEGLISAQAARKLYGVALRGNMSLDEKATAKLRDRLRSGRKSKKKPAGRKRAKGKRG